MNWKFWKKSNAPKKKKSATREWVDALVFAVIAAPIIFLPTTAELDSLT